MKRITLLTVLLLCGMLLFGCGDRTSSTDASESAAPVLPDEAQAGADLPGGSETQKTPEPTAETNVPPSAEAPADAGQPAGISLSWAKAFRISTLPEGVITPDEIAFFSFDADNREQITNVPKEEVFAYRPERLPRTRTLDRYIPDNLETLLVTMDYALAHGYSRFSIPTTEFTYADILGVHNYLNRIYWIDGRGINSLDVQSFETEDGKTLTYILVAISAIPNYQKTKQYLEGVAAAEKIVDSIPEGSSEFQKALYLYQYLTDNVRYDYNSYYEEGKKVLLYDALVMHKTVCAGYTEALYYLYNLAGIDCMVIRGYITNPAPLGGHAWNIARIDGSYYQFDSTWDAGLVPSYYAYFAVSDAYMMAHHTQNVETFSSEFAPPCPQSLLPEIRIAGIDSEQKSLIFYYYRFLETKETAPMDLLLQYGIDPDRFAQTEAEDGWFVTGMEYSFFRSLLSVLLDTAEADRFCDGCYADRDGMLAFRKPTEQTVGWRLCDITENADGSYLTEAYRIDGTGAVHRVSHLFRIADGIITSVTEQ